MMSRANESRFAALLFLATIVFPPGKSFSQIQLQSSSICKHCLNAKRYPACCSYWVTDAGIGVFTSSFNYRNSSNVMLFGDLGYMVNLNEKTSLGGTFFGATDEDRARAGVRFRYRRWLSDKTTLDFSPGLLFLGGHANAEAFWPAFIVTGHISYNSRINGYVGMEFFRVKSYTSFLPYGVTPSGKSNESSFFVGAGLGQEAGMACYGVLAGLIIIIALTYNYSISY